MEEISCTAMSLKIISALWVALDREEQMTNPQDIKTTYLPPREGQCHLSFTPGHYIRSLNFLFHILRNSTLIKICHNCTL